MANDAPGMRGNRSRNNSDGRLRDTRDDKHVGDPAPENRTVFYVRIFLQDEGRRFP